MANVQNPKKNDVTVSNFQAEQLADLLSTVRLFYAVLSLNVVALGLSHLGTAPHWMSILVPGVVAIASIVRILHYSFGGNRQVAKDDVAKLLTRLRVRSTVLAVVCTAWALGLSTYSQGAQDVHIVFFLSMVGLATAICGLGYQSIAYGVLTIVNIAFFTWFLFGHGYVYTLITICFAVISVCTLQALSRHTRLLKNLFLSRQALAEEHEEVARLSAANAELASRDFLTNLYNRRGFLAALDTVTEDKSAGGTCAVAVIDLDRFKMVNDVYGHSAGDHLLIEVSQRIQYILGDHAHTARLGGDEFGIVFKRHIDEQRASEMCREICRALKMPVVLPGAQKVDITGTIGLAVGEADTADGKCLYDEADYALTEQKQISIGSVSRFSKPHEVKRQRQFHIEQALRHDGFEEDLQLVFQPSISIKTGRVEAMDALARWSCPGLGPIGPEELFQIMEEAGTASQLTVEVLKLALAAAEAWPSRAHLSFKLTASDIGNRNTVDTVIGVLRASDIPPNRIIIELTQASLNSRRDEVVRSMAKLRHIGCKISLGDFGMGQACLGLLHKYDFDQVKVDRQFISTLSTQPRTKPLLEAIFSLCDKLNVDCLVEGIETADQLDVIKALGGDLVQGYLISPPLPGEETLDFILGIRAEGPASKRA